MKLNAKRFQLAVVFFTAFPILTIVALAATGNFKTKQLRVFGEVPQFSLFERNGQTITKESFRGKVWVASFVFTHCAGQCPLIMQEMKRIQKALHFKENFRLLSVTVDPKRDTPEVLTEYAAKLDADPFKWWFVTGKVDEIQALVQNGFRLSMADEGGDAAMDVTHSQKLILVDHVGRIRGYYDANEPDEVKTLLKDAKELIRKSF